MVSDFCTSIPASHYGASTLQGPCKATFMFHCLIITPKISIRQTEEDYRARILLVIIALTLLMEILCESLPFIYISKEFALIILILPSNIYSIISKKFSKYVLLLLLLLLFSKLLATLSWPPLLQAAMHFHNHAPCLLLCSFSLHTVVIRFPNRLSVYYCIIIYNINTHYISYRIEF